MTKVKVILKKHYQDEILKHILILNQTTASFHDFEGNPVYGTIIGVSTLNEETQLLIVDNKSGIYNRNINEVSINGKYEVIK